MGFNKLGYRSFALSYSVYLHTGDWHLIGQSNLYEKFPRVFLGTYLTGPLLPYHLLSIWIKVMLVLFLLLRLVKSVLRAHKYRQLRPWLARKGPKICQYLYQPHHLRSRCLGKNGLIGRKKKKVVPGCREKGRFGLKTQLWYHQFEFDDLTLQFFKSRFPNDRVNRHVPFFRKKFWALKAMYLGLAAGVLVERGCCSNPSKSHRKAIFFLLLFFSLTYYSRWTSSLSSCLW